MIPNSVYRIQRFRGGISDENDKGILGAFKFGYGLNIRDRDDVLQCNQALVKESGVIVTGLINFFVSCTDGNIYGFSNNGKIYKRTSAGAWSLVYTDAGGAILGADEWNGYFYWATATALHTMIITGNWTTDVDSVTQAKVDTLTLYGSVGTASITAAGGLTKTVTFNTNLTTTASDFVTANAAAYLAQGIVLTSSGSHLIFTAQTAGTTFVTPVITNVTGDLIGSVVDTTDNVKWPATLTNAAWHTMIKATGNLLICNANKLAMVDYSTPAVFTDDAVDLIPGNLTKCLEESDELVLIGTTRSDNDEMGHLWSWEPTSLNWIQKKKIATKGVNAFITSELMLAQCGIDGEVYYSDMAQKVPVFIFPDGGYCLPGGVCGRKGLALFGVFGNGSTKCGIYSYGRNRKNYPYTLSLDYVPSPGLLTGVVIGALQMANGTLLAAWQTGGTVTITIANPCVVTWSSHGQATGTPILFTTTGALPTGITASTYYYIRVIDADTFNLYDTAAHAIAGGSTGRVTTSGTQSGTQTGANYGVDALSTTVKASGVYEGLEWDGDMPERKKKFLQVKFLTDPFPAGCSIVLKYKINRAAAWTTAKTVDGNSSFSTADDKKAVFNINDEGETIEFRIEITPSGNTSPVIRSCNAFFNLSGKILN